MQVCFLTQTGAGSSRLLRVLRARNKTLAARRDGFRPSQFISSKQSSARYYKICSACRRCGAEEGPRNRCLYVYTRRNITIPRKVFAPSCRTRHNARNGRETCVPWVPKAQTIVSLKPPSPSTFKMRLDSAALPRTSKFFQINMHPNLADLCACVCVVRYVS